MNNGITRHGKLPVDLTHRNLAAAELSNRIKQARSETYDDAWRLMGPITFNVNLNPNNHSDAKMNGVIECLKAGKEFILFTDYDNYTIFIPRFRKAVQFRDGQEMSSDVTDNDHNWISRVKAGMITHEHFFINKRIDAQPTEVLQLREEDSRGSSDPGGDGEDHM